MSTPILPFAAWQSGTNQNSIPANDNSLRNQILNGLVIGTANDEAGGDADGDIYIVGSSPVGAFATFDQYDLAIFMSGNWYAFAPVVGIIVNIAGAANAWDGSSYVAVTTGGGGGSDRSTVTAVTSTAGVVTLNYALGDYFTLALSENVNSGWVVSNPPGSGKGGTLAISITQDSTPRTVAFPSSWNWGDGNSAPTMPTGSGDVLDVIITSFDNFTTAIATARMRS